MTVADQSTLMRYQQHPPAVTTVGGVLDIVRIKEMIPHRYPFLLIDRVQEVVKGESAVGIKAVSAGEPYFQGHFPDKPVMPGVLIVEAMAQTAAVLVVDALGEKAEGKLVYFMSVETAKFRKPVGPGDTLHLRVTRTLNRRNVWKFDGLAYVDDVLVAESSFAAMIADD